MPCKRIPAVIALLAVLAVLACGGDTPSGPRPNLEVVTLNAPGSAVAGARIDIAVGFDNTGDGPAEESQAEVRLSTSATTVTKADTLLATMDVPGLGPGSGFTVHGTVTVPAVPAGQYYLWVIADARQRFDEASPAGKQVDVPLTVGAAPGSDMDRD
jgi:hypothetical protein